MSLFTLSEDHPGAPLAVRMRPRSLDEVLGQESVLRAGSPLRRLIDGTGGSSVILWGPPGTGKTTIATLISAATDREFVELSAVTAGVKDVRAGIERARELLAINGRGTVMFVDEVHRFSKTQQDALLPAVENGWVTLVAATTENPSFSVVSPLLSRSLLLVLEPLSESDVARLLERAVSDPRGLGGRIGMDEQAKEVLCRLAGGDARRALTMLEAAAGGIPTGATLTADAVAEAIQRTSVRYDRDGDQHYDVASALIKSIRGSDVDAAMHYLARMVEAGEDPRFIARRLVILASEDIGLADPTALQTAVAAMQAVSFIGLPEARITLAQAVIHLSLAPKSNAAYLAIDAAIADIRSGRIGNVPVHLRDAHYAGAKKLPSSTGAGHGVGYVYPHDVPGAVAAQAYAPDLVAGRRYYNPTGHGVEARFREVLGKVRVALGRDPAPDAAEGNSLGLPESKDQPDNHPDNRTDNHADNRTDNHADKHRDRGT